jgi:hypothetical protein
VSSLRMGRIRIRSPPLRTTSGDITILDAFA